MTAERGGAPYLKRMKITSFGAFANKVAGPFTPHLNVVFGEIGRASCRERVSNFV